MKKRFFVTLLVGLSAALSAAWAQEGAQEAAVRVVHLVPNGPNVDITLNGEAALQGLAAGTVSGYVSVPAGQYDVEVVAAGGTAAAAQAEVPAGDAEAVGTEVDAVGTELGEAGNELEQAVTGGAAEVEQAVTGTATELEQAVTGGVGVIGQDLQAAQTALPTLFASIRETINAQDFEGAQDQIEEAQQNLETLQVGAATDESVQGVQETLQVAQEALDTPEAAPAALEALDQAEQQYGQIDVAGIESAVAGAEGVTGAQPVVTDTEAGVDQVGVDQAGLQESLAAMPTLFASIREAINLQDYQLAQDQIEETQQVVQDVGGVGTDAVLPSLELIQEQLQTAQEALDEPDPTVALAAIDEAESTFSQVEGDLGATTGAATGGAAGVEQGQAIATATLTLEPGQYYTVVAAQTQEALEGRINISAQPGQAEINVTGPNGFAESFVGNRQLEALTPGNYIIAGTLVGYQSAQQQVEAQAGETLAADLTLDPLTQEQIAETPGEVTGGATGGAEAQAGFPESPALVQLLVFQDSLDLPPAGQALVRIIHASPDAPAVNVVAQAAAEAEAVTGGAAEAGALEITLDPAETVITVTGPDGYAEEFTGSQTLEGLAPGEYVIAATLEGYQPTETTVEVAPGEVLPVEVILEAEPATESPFGTALANAFAPYTALLGLQLDQELGGYVSGAVTALEADDLETAQQDLRAALLAVQAQLEGAEGDTLQTLQSTETTIQDAITALENDDTEGALATLQTVQGAQTGGAAVEVEATGGATGGETGGVTGADQTGGAQTGGAQTGGAPAEPTQVDGSVETAVAALEAGDVTGAQNELRAVLLVVQGQIETAEGDQLTTLQATEASVQEALTALEADNQELALTTLQDAQAGVVVTTEAATGGAVAEAPADAQAQVQGQTLVTSLTTGNASSYVAVPAGTYQLQVQTAEGGNVVIDIPDSTLEGGVVYTFYAFGSPSQGTLAINVSVDALVAQQIR